MELIFRIILGWPAVLLGITLLICGISFNKYLLSIAGAFLASGFCLYVFAYPFLARWIGLAAFFCNFISAVAVKKKHTPLAAVFMLPVILLALYMAYLVSHQHP